MKKWITMLLIFTLILPNMVSYADEVDKYQGFSDISGHWAEETIRNHQKMGMLKGYPDGTFRPDTQMKRSELITLINKYFGLKEGDKENFEDVTGQEWYAKETARARYYGYIEELQARPDDFATREDIVNMIDVLIDIEEQRVKNDKKSFKDLEGLHHEEKEKMEKFSQMGYISGYEDGTIRPERIINRAEILTIVENVLGYVVTSQEDIHHMPKDVTKVTIINPNIILENKVINGDIYISPGVNGKIIKDCKIKGQVHISGAGKDDSIAFENVEVEKIVVTKAKIEPRITIKGRSRIGEIKTKAKTAIALKDGTEIEKLITRGDTKIAMEKGSQIVILEAEEKTNITGKGRIERAKIKAEGVFLEERPEHMVVDEDIDGVYVGNNRIDSKNDDDIENKQDSGNGNGSNDHDEDITPPRWAEGYPYGEMKLSEGKIVIKTKIDEPGTIYYTVEDGDKDFTVDELIHRGYSYDTDGNTVMEEVYGSNLESEKDYTAYFTAVDQQGNKQDSIKKIKVKTIDDQAPQWEKGYPYASMKSSEEKINIFTNLDEDATVYYKVYEASYRDDFLVDDLINIGDSFNTQGKTVAQEVYGPVKSGTTYKIHLTAVDKYNNKQSDIEEITVSEIDTTPPIFTKKEGEIIDRQGTIEFSAQTNEFSTIYYILVDEGSPVPTAEQVKAGIDYNGVSILAQGNKEEFTNAQITSIPYGKNYEMYLAAEDTSGNITREVPKIFMENPVAAKIKAGYIPIANKNELKQMEISSNNIFGAETAWEGVYTGGMDKKYMLVADIDLTGDNFVPVGYDEAEDRSVAFTGKLTGEGYKISNLSIERNKKLQGLFSKLGTGSKIWDMTLENVTMKTGSQSGVLAGEADGTEISNLSIVNVDYDLFTDQNINGFDFTEFIGGFVGKSRDTKFNHLELMDFDMELKAQYNNAFVRRFGGIVGLADGGEFQKCRVEDLYIATIHHPADWFGYNGMKIGGLIGEIKNSTTKTLSVDHCTAVNLDMIISGFNFDGSNIGGLVGIVDTDADGVETQGDIVISNSNTWGSLKGKGIHWYGTNGAGGFVGKVDGSNAPSGFVEIKNCGTAVEISDLEWKESARDTLAKGGVGGFAAYLNNVKVQDSYAEGSINSDYLVTGGFAGLIHNSELYNCSASGDISGYKLLFCGGFAAFIDNTKLEHCNASGDISSDGALGCGSFAGQITNSELDGCHARGVFSGEGAMLCGDFAAIIFNSKINP